MQHPVSENCHVMIVRAMAETMLWAKLNYYRGFPTITDEVYDALETQMQKLCPGHPILEAVGEASFDCLLGMVATRELIQKNSQPVKKKRFSL